MSTVLSTQARPQDAAGQASGGLFDILKRLWTAYLVRKMERAAIAHLCAMSDRELKDLGLTRPQIVDAVRGAPLDRPFSHYY